MPTSPTRHCAIYTDGGARGNPGPAAAGGVIIDDNGAVVAEVSEYLGVATNNVAEYRALVVTLQRALAAGFNEADIYVDSELVVKQLSGEYKVKDAKIFPLHQRARRLLSRFSKYAIAHILRERNRRADKLVNAALDAHAAGAIGEPPPEPGRQESLL